MAPEQDGRVRGVGGVRGGRAAHRSGGEGDVGRAEREGQRVAARQVGHVPDEAVVDDRTRGDREGRRERDRARPRGDADRGRPAHVGRPVVEPQVGEVPRDDPGHRGELDRDLVDGGVGERVAVELEAEEIDAGLREPAVELVRHLARGVGAEQQRVVDEVSGVRRGDAAHVAGENGDVPGRERHGERVVLQEIGEVGVERVVLRLARDHGEVAAERDRPGGARDRSRTDAAHVAGLVVELQVGEVGPDHARDPGEREDDLVDGHVVPGPVEELEAEHRRVVP